jgi:hypothetical protein
LQNFRDSEDINRTGENINENIKTSAKESLGLYELKRHKPRFDEECSHLLDQRKCAKMPWLRDPNRSNVNNLNNVGRDASRHFSNKKKEYLKTKIDYLETNSKIKNIRELYKSINDFKKRYQTRSNIIKDEKGDLVIDCHSISARWRNHFSQPFDVQGIHDVRQTAIHRAKP